MADLNLKDLPRIDPGSPMWEAVEKWAHNELEVLRKSREQLGTDLRKLDVALGAIRQLEALLVLPAEINREHARDPVSGDGFGIPTPRGM